MVPVTPAVSKEESSGCSNKFTFCFLLGDPTQSFGLILAESSFHLGSESDYVMEFGVSEEEIPDDVHIFK